MLIDIGPVTLVLKGEKGGEDYRFDRASVTARVEAILTDIRECLPVLKQRAWRIKNTTSLTPVARKMIEAAKSVDAEALTPMAAVAGAVADELKEYLKKEDLDFISVNNGGDVAIYNRRHKPVSISIGDIRRNSPTSYVLRVEELTDFGVATSGFGGRSFTLGLADMASVVASSAPVADAAATFICNSTNVEEASIVRRKAAEIDPLTDIPEEMVTVHIGDLSPESVREALAHGEEVAKRLKREGKITEAVILLRRDMATTIEGDGNIRLEVKCGN